MEGLITRGRERFWRWERRTAARFSGWSVRRRWVVLVLVPTLLVCCGGTVVGVPVAWVLRTTIEASRGAPSPDAAASEYLMALGYGNEAGLLAVLDNAEGDALLEQWRDYRDAMKTTAPRPSKLEIGALTTGPIEAGRAQVVAEVRPVWWGTSGGLAVNGEVHTWTFLTREDDGWQISAVEPFTWCGGYVRADACAGG